MEAISAGALNIKFLKGATLEHINVRKQGNEDNSFMALDLKLAGECSNSCLPRILGCEPNQVDVFWREDGDFNPLFSGLTEIKSWAEFENCELILDVREQSFKGVKVKNIRFKPVSNLNVILTISVSIEDVGNSDMPLLANQLRETMGCEIIGQPEFSLTVETSPNNMQKTVREVQQHLLGDDDESDTPADSLYADAVSLVKREKKASISQVQRNFKIGYNRAARLVEQMEFDGIVSAMKSNGQRELIG